MNPVPVPIVPPVPVANEPKPAPKIPPPKKPKKLSPQEELIKNYTYAAVAAGCPVDQIVNFINAGVFLQPKQLRFAALARQCDLPNGPKDIMLGGGRGSAKALALDTPILTFSGWKTMGQIQIGDRVFDENGKPCFVLEKSEIFKNHECYEIEFDNGDRIVADAGHRWLTISKSEQKAIDRRNPEFRKKRRETRGKTRSLHLVGCNVLPPPPQGTVKTTSEIFKTIKVQNGRESNHRVKISKPLVLDSRPLPIHPYLLGIWLGDGSRNAGRITSNDPAIFDRLASLEIDSYKMNQKYEWRIVGFTARLRDLNLYENKHIPEQFFWGDFSQRLELLRGLMDSDGTCSKNGMVSFTNTDKVIIDGICRLICSLGVKCSMTTGVSKLYGKECARYWRVYFCPTFNPFGLKRKAERFTPATRKTNFNHYMVSCKKIKSVPTVCISVSSKSNLFLVGKSLIATHNTHGILAQIFCDDCQRVADLKVLVVRKVGRSNKEQISDFRKKLLGALPHKYREQQSTITFENGSTVILGNFKDERDLDKYLGLEYDLIHIVESNQITLTKKMNILSCLRTNKPNWRPRCYEDTNPGGIGHFHNKQIFIEPWKAKKETETRYVHCVVDDNKFVNVEYKEYLEKLSGWQREAWLYGSWDFLAGAYFTNFRDDIHVYPNPAVQFSANSVRRWFGAFDYGFAHMSAFVLFAMDEKGCIYVVDEYQDNEKTPSDHAERIKALLRKNKLEPSDLESIVAGHDCFHRKEEGNTIAQTYAENGLDFIPAENARVNGWQRIMDGFGDSNTGRKPTMFIHNQCVHLIAQIKMAQHSEKIPGDVQKFDYVGGDTETLDGASQEGDDLLDACFVAGTLIKTENGDIAVEKIKVGDMVWTRQGLNRVVKTGKRLAKTISVRFDNGSCLTGTPEHPVYSPCRGFIRLDSLRYGDIVSSWKQNPKPSCSKEENSVATPTRQKDICDATSSPVKSNRLEKACRFIRKFTSITTKLKRFRRVSTSIIKTETHSTTKSKTSNVCHVEITAKGTKTTRRVKLGNISPTLSLSEFLQQNGMEPKTGASGIQITGRLGLEQGLFFGCRFVNFAKNHFKQIQQTFARAFVQTNANRHGAEKPAQTTKKEFASVVGKNLSPTNTAIPEIAAASVVDICGGSKNTVYNLEVEDCHEYFANEILVHNCRYGVFSNTHQAIKFAMPIAIGRPLAMIGG